MRLVGHVPPTVSVITATYNSSRTLRTALASLRAQDFDDWEAWIIGDGCTDDSADVVESFADTRFHWENLDSNHGSQSFPNNVGLRRAQSRYIAYLGHDDLWMPNHLSELIRSIESTQADLVHSICALFGREGWEGCVGPPRADRGYTEHYVPPSCWLHRRSLVETVGDWSDPGSVAIAVDVDYLRRIHRAGKVIACSPHLTVAKFPSWWIGLYSMTTDPPQEALWARIQQDRHAVEHEWLDLAATQLAEQQWGGSRSFGASVREAFESCKLDIRRATEQWPLLSQYWIRRQQNRRRAMAKKRGLL